ncbi:hypothetical protein MTO96_035724 [Rhipicephalus appendiculatus]
MNIYNHPGGRTRIRCATTRRRHPIGLDEVLIKATLLPVMRLRIDASAVLRPHLSRTDFPRGKAADGKTGYDGDYEGLPADYTRVVLRRAGNEATAGNGLSLPVGRKSSAKTRTYPLKAFVTSADKTLPLLIDRPRGHWASLEGGFALRQEGKVKQQRVLHGT